ncbi:S-adenosyl-L-methionine-dependent methyltransferase [Lindgomyces ingoldianus]|uniref:S-adenosyl-L-methionine-dependent methyltransferase n=1 Tax=Lindgomyces ingoldianus TaxID=673940 RepID=A0ACB6R319_9PLEO|nr:S-adenosyl-L-methionine-dependent methyltransferase [Lindgomyces ingoldianus]KAF2473185.1 S-adenosyl-L-methionine-dependent methyltransferase [Lindgomyces ingoldianus]
MDTIASQVRDLYNKADEEGRRTLQHELSELQRSLDTEWDMVIRLASGTLQMALAKIGSHLQLFELLAASEIPLSLSHFVEKTKASPELLGHLMRTQAAFGLFKETGKDEFTANRMTKALADPDVAGAIAHATDVHSAVAHVLPDFLKARRYQNMTSNKDTPFQMAMKTDLTPFEWMKDRPEQMKSLGHAMRIQRAGNWTDSYPVEREVGAFSPAPNSALLVDVGGGFGQQSIAFKSRFPSLPGRIVVQDIPATLDQAKTSEGIEFMVQDFFQPQALKAAKFYYLRHVLHDWMNDDCIKILKAIVPAMGPESRVIIDEVVLPDTNVPWQAAYMDITMMASLGGMERTKAEWEILMDQAGLKILEIHKYDPKMQSIIVAAPQ